MFERFGGFIIRSRVFVIIFWLLLAGLIFFKAPVLSDVAKSDQTSFLPKDSENAKASQLLKQLYPDKGSGSSLVLVLDRKGGLRAQDKTYASDLEKYLDGNSKGLRIRAVTSPLTKTEFEDSMMSKDGEAMLLMVNLNVSSYQDTTSQAVKDIRAIVHPDGTGAWKSAPAVPDGLAVNVTGDAPLGQETVDNVHDSMDLTMKITILLVLFVLLLVYRSPVAPFVPLFTIGLSFLVSRGLIAMLTEFGLKVSSFTETFLIAVLFGAGTDYCLLLTSRFREEIVKGKAPREALRAAYPSTALAIVSSGGTVVVGFFAMVIAQFGLYNTTGPSIAIGVLVTIAAVLTITPALTGLLGERIFWPAHPSRNVEKERLGSPFWNRLSAAVTTKPARFIVICLVVFIPFMLSTLCIVRSFDSLADLPKSSDAVKGFNVIKRSFEQGEMLPVKIVLKSDKDLWSNDSLRVIDDIAKAIKKVDTVARVRTATRPLGEQITETTLPSQLDALTSGLGEVNQGFAPILDGLGTLKGGVSQVAGGVSDGSSGLQKLIDSTGKVTDGLSAIKGQVGGMSSAIKDTAGKTQASAAQLKQGLDGVSAGLAQSRDGVDKLLPSLNDAFTKLGALGKQQPALMKDPNYMTAYGTLQAVLPKMQELSQGMAQVSSGVDQMRSELGSASSVDTSSLDKGITSLQQALDSLGKALASINDGQRQLKTGLDKASSSLSAVASGFDQSSEGLKKMETGVSQAKDAAGKYSGGNTALDDVFYLPEGALEKYPQLKDAMSEYISPDGKGVTFDVVLSTSPYTKEALDSVKEIRDAAMFALKDSYLDKSELELGGATVAYSELRDITSSDFVKVVIFVLLGIFIVLMLLLRSLTAPLYLILTIILSFAATMGLSYIMFQVILGYEGLTWSVPFFSFCILVALGVDYNIFLMSRVKEEYRTGDMKGGVARALASTGKIITSCGIIMAGTFGALMASSVHQLVEIGFTAVIGLLLDTFLIRCLLVPAIAVKIGELNWWPGRKVKVVAAESIKDM